MMLMNVFIVIVIQLHHHSCSLVVSENISLASRRVDIGTASSVPYHDPTNKKKQTLKAFSYI